MLWLLYFVAPIECARILAVYPTPLISHQSVFRALTHELIARGHELVVITPLPEYSKGSAPINLHEIDVGNVTIEAWNERYNADILRPEKNRNAGLQVGYKPAAEAVKSQFAVPEVKQLINNNETFDLLILDMWIEATLLWTYVNDAPVICLSSAGAFYWEYTQFGGPNHPILYPSIFQQNINNPNSLDKIVAMYKSLQLRSARDVIIEEEAMARNIFGFVPPIKKRVHRIEMVFLNTFLTWPIVRPAPKTILHLGGMHIEDRHLKYNLSEDFVTYLNLSKPGVIYVSFGTDRQAGMLTARELDTLRSTFGRLEYDILWEWYERMSNVSWNVRVEEWFPQAELLKHPKVLLFISQCGLQSVDEAIAAGVPVLCIPLAGDQWRNAEDVVRHRVGTSLPIGQLTEKLLKHGIKSVIGNQSYRHNMVNLRSLLYDRPVKAPVCAANWVEYVLKHRTVAHLASPQSSWIEDIELIVIFLALTTNSVLVSVIILKKLCSRLLRRKFSWYVQRSSPLPMIFE